MIRKKLTDIQKLEIGNLYKQGLSSVILADKYNWSDSGIRKILEKLGIKRRGLFEATRKYTLKVNYFDKIDTQEKAILLGLLMADGNVYNTHIAILLQERDKDILEFFKREIEYNGPLYFYAKEKIKKAKQNYFKLKVTSKQMIPKLLIYNIVPNKSLITIFPHNIPKEFWRGFILGVFLGDGSISISKKRKGDCTFSICGASLEFLEQIQVILMKECLLSKTKIYKKKDKNVYKLAYSGRQQCIRIYNWLFNNIQIPLFRKQKKFMEIL